MQTGADGSIRLRITDIEPASRTLVALDSLAPALVRLKLRRRFARYRRLFGMTLGSGRCKAKAATFFFL